MKFRKILLDVFCITSFLFGAEKSIIIEATPIPHAEVLNFAKPISKKRSWDLEIKESSDYNIPNIPLNEKGLDADLCQHKPFLEDSNVHKGTKLSSLGSTVLVPMTIYSNDIRDIKNIPSGAKIVTSNDVTSESGASDLLAEVGLIEFRTSNILRTPINISKDPENLKLIELKAVRLPRTLNDVDLAVIIVNHTFGAGLDPLRDGILIEDKDNLYTIALAARRGNEKNEKSLTLKEILTSGKTKNSINEQYKGSVIPTS